MHGRRYPATAAEAASGNKSAVPNIPAAFFHYRQLKNNSCKLTVPALLNSNDSESILGLRSPQLAKSLQIVHRLTWRWID
jgi:hypothetical protein